jgi:hypothetical protein
MMHPEMMHVVISSHHEYLRSLAKDESFLDELRHVTRSLRNALGRGMVRTGRWLEGHTPSSVGQGPAAAFQEP